MAITDEDLGFQIQTRLAGDATVSALVSEIRPMVLEENDPLPAIRYEVINYTPWKRLNAPMTDGQTRLQIDCYARTNIEAATVAEAVRKSLHGFSGTLGSVRVFDCVMDNRYDRVDPPPPGSKHWRKRRTMDFLISHSDPAPTL